MSANGTNLILLNIDSSTQYKIKSFASGNLFQFSYK